MKWYELALNHQSLESLYDIVPELEFVELFSICLTRDNSRIQVRFNLPNFPDRPPKKWHKEFNTAQAQLEFFDVTRFEAKEWHNNMQVKINIEKIEKSLRVVISNPELNLFFSFLCEFFRVEYITGYTNTIDK